jgi:hypothetical protein
MAIMGSESCTGLEEVKDSRSLPTCWLDKVVCIDVFTDWPDEAAETERSIAILAYAERSLFSESYQAPSHRDWMRRDGSRAQAACRRRSMTQRKLSLAAKNKARRARRTRARHAVSCVDAAAFRDPSHFWQTVQVILLLALPPAYSHVISASSSSSSCDQNDSIPCVASRFRVQSAVPHKQ